MNTEKILEYAVAIAELAKKDMVEQRKTVDLLNQKTLGECAPGDTFDAEGIEMLVLDISEDGEKALCITKDLYASHITFGDSTQYEGSNAESAVKEFEKHIIECFGEDSLVEHTTKIVTVDGQEVGSYTGKARFMTFDETRTYNHLIVNNDLSDWWWLLCPWSTPERGWKQSVACFAPGGGIRSHSCNHNGGVRPICILKSSIFIPR